MDLDEDMLDMDLDDEQDYHESISDHIISIPVLPTPVVSYAPSSVISNPNAGVVISKIEDIIEKMLDCLIDDSKEIFIELKANRGRKLRVANASPTPSRHHSRSITRLRFPGKTSQEAWKFTVVLRVLELMHEALIAGSVITKRDIYYRDPDLFEKQSVVDRYVDNLAFTFGVERSDLNIVAAAKGLLAGHLKITKRDGTVVDCARNKEGILVPNIKDVTSIDIGSTKWILVIEKEASFSAIATGRYTTRSAAGDGILVTAKGYPDIQTRAFLHLVETQYPATPIYALVDYDPDGLAIYSTYKYGSASLAHENTSLVVSSIQWLGLHSHDFMKQCETKSHELVPLSARERNKARALLAQEESDEKVDSLWKRELQTMLVLGYKAEIQILGNATQLEKYLDKKLTM